MALTIKGQVLQVFPTKSGEWARVIVGSASRVNDLVMLRADTVKELGVKAGQTIELPVRALVDSNAEGRPTRNITFFHENGGPTGEMAATAG